jgi:ABC-type uncharacterized transport system fused permease/ATPase subunit
MTLVVISFALIAFGLAIAKPLSRWIADRPDNFDPDIIPLKDSPRTAEEKRKLLQDQVVAKIHWDANEDDVLDWLICQQGLAEAEAETMVALALENRKRSIRRTAALNTVACVLGLFFTAVLVVIQFVSEVIYLWSLPLLMVTMMLCAMGLARYSIRLLSGRTDANVDD